jgi:fatty acid desaturase (delta-4 desaturase)
MHVNQAYHWYLFAPLGFLMALIGLNIQHDANHGSISRSSTVNRALGLTQNWIGGSALDWIHQHVVQVLN